MRVALCMRGAISKKKGDFHYKNQLYMNSEYVDFKKCYDSIKKHIIDVNKEHHFDIFCQSWSYNLENEIKNLYNPVKYNFEDNKKYNDEISSLCTPNNFSGVSQALAIKKTIELKEEYEKEQNIKYDIVILYRYDVLLWKNMILNEYENIFNNDIYVNAHSDCNGDFHFVMNNNNSYEFKYLYDSIKLGNACIMHYWIKNYVLNFMKKTIIMDKIVPGKNQEVIRKIPPHNVVINFG